MTVPELELLRLDLELENRAYFAGFEVRFAQLLVSQAEGTDYLHVLMADGSADGRYGAVARGGPPHALA